jgi:hypothetical protein
MPIPFSIGWYWCIDITTGIKKIIIFDGDIS